MVTFHYLITGCLALSDAGKKFSINLKYIYRDQYMSFEQMQYEQTKWSKIHLLPCYNCRNDLKNYYRNGDKELLFLHC